MATAANVLSLLLLSASSLLLLLSVDQPQASAQQLTTADGERLKAALLANLNKFGQLARGHPQTAHDGPLEPIGAFRPATAGLAAASHHLHALPAVVSTEKPDRGGGGADRRYQAAPMGFARSAVKEKEKRWRKAADMIGDWRRKMYKMFKSTRGKGSKPGQQQPPAVLLLGQQHSLIDQRKADNLARLFGVGNRHKSPPQPPPNGSSERRDRRRKQHLHSNDHQQLMVQRPQRSERRRKSGKAAVGTASAAAQGTGASSAAADWDIYGDEPPPLEQEEEEFEVVYVPALKRRLGEEAKLAQSRSPVPGEQQTWLASSRPPHLLLDYSSASPPASTAVPPPALAFAPTLPSSSPVPPLQFPTLLPPLISFTLPPALNPLAAMATPIQPAPPPLSPAAAGPNEREFLRELENVPEDYVEEQERQLPCLHRPGSELASADCKRSRPTASELAAVQQQQQTQLLDEQQFPWDENREMCNSARLRSLIQQAIVPSSVEKSKRVLQQRAEAQFGAFYNVVCGTGFFSYIAHTDEFCLVAVQDVHCYVFSPVCASQLSLASGIARQRLVTANKHQQHTQLLTGRRHFLNRN